MLKEHTLFGLVDVVVRPCVSCGALAVLKNEDGEYCKTCMEIHLLEKLFVQLNQKGVKKCQ